MFVCCLLRNTIIPILIYNSFDETGPDAQLIVSTFQETWIMQLFILFTHICPDGDLHDQLTDEQLLSVVF